MRNWPEVAFNVSTSAAPAYVVISVAKSPTIAADPDLRNCIVSSLKASSSMRPGAPLTEDGCEFEPPLWRRRQAAGALWGFQSVRFFLGRLHIRTQNLFPARRATAIAPRVA